MLNISIVLFKTSYNSISNILNILSKQPKLNKIYLVDNSPDIDVSYKNLASNIQYIFNNKNIGYGAAHNIAIKESFKENIKYHLVMNSDLNFDLNTINHLIHMMESDSELGLAMPKVLNIDGSVQVLPKLLPSPFNLIIRVISPIGFFFNSMNKKYTLDGYDQLQLNVPIISGCFSLFRVSALEQIGLYDENFFMYFEDFDISRRMHKEYKTIYCPNVSIIHAHERGAAKSFKLFRVFISSAFNYFNKYGWFFDKERSKINSDVIGQLEKQTK